MEKNMEEITIRGKVFDKEEVKKRGATKIKIISNVFRWLGLAIFLTGFIPTCFLMSPSINEATGYSGAYLWGFFFVPIFGPHLIVGLVFFFVSFKKRNALRYGIDDIKQELPPGDKTLVVQVNNPEARTPDKFDEIIKYKTLLDQGIITQEEFEEKKRELL